MRFSSPWPRRATASPHRGHGIPLRLYTRALIDLGPRRPDSSIRGLTPSITARASSSLTSGACRHGSIRASQQPSAFQMFPIPATFRWSISASPIARASGHRLVAARGTARVVERRSEHVRAEAASRWSKRAPAPGHQLEHRPVELNHLGVRRARAPATPAVASGSSGAPERTNVPRAGHPQVRVEDKPALEDAGTGSCRGCGPSVRRGRPAAPASDRVSVSRMRSLDRIGHWPTSTGRIRCRRP